MVVSILNCLAQATGASLMLYKVTVPGRIMNLSSSAYYTVERNAKEASLDDAPLYHCVRTRPFQSCNHGYNGWCRNMSSRKLRERLKWRSGIVLKGIKCLYYNCRLKPDINRWNEASVTQHQGHHCHVLLKSIFRWHISFILIHIDELFNHLVPLFAFYKCLQYINIVAWGKARLLDNWAHVLPTGRLSADRIQRRRTDKLERRRKVEGRSRAGSNRCTSFCRALPNHSATGPYKISVAPNSWNRCKSRVFLKTQ